MTNDQRSKSVFRKDGLQVSVRSIPFASPEERQELLMNMAIGSQFDMRYRGHYEYYGKEFIAYKLGHPSQKANEFLRVLSGFMANCLEDDCPPSWQECNESFWEELIFTFYPHHMKISQQRKESETFLTQLKKYVQWLDRRVGTTWYSVVEKMAAEAYPQLKVCENLLNDIMLRDFPRIFHSDWDPPKDIEKMEQKYANCDDSLLSVFELKSLIDGTLVLSELDANKNYYIKGLPTKYIEPGLIMCGVIGKKKGEKAWTWFRTDCICPSRGKRYLRAITPIPC